MKEILACLSPLCLFRLVLERAGEERLRVRSIVLLTLVLSLTGVIIRSVMRGSVSPLDLVVLAALALAWGSTYTRFYSIGAFFLILVMSLAAYFGALHRLQSGTQDVTAWLVWLALPLFLVPLLFSRRALWLALAIPLVTLLLFIALERPVNWGAMLAVLSIGSVLSALVARIYETQLSLLAKQREELERAYSETLQAWAKILEARDKETEGHSERVAELTLRLAQAMGIRDPLQLRFIRYGCLLHDIGKIAIPDSILQKPGPLTAEERRIMELHVVYAYEWLKDVAFLHPALEIPYCHHEKWDGSGYPRGLKGEEIPAPARLFAIVDVWDALTSNRPYRSAWSEEKA
ncbi:MAG: HD-GYP domain-containing protein, partial [Anaerolineales bacterium]